MATIFRSLFGHKKSHSKGDDDNGNEQQMDRESSRRSYRVPKSSSSRGARFQDDSMLPATAAYHTQNTARVRRGPKSCPGEYVEEEPARSFMVDQFRQERQDHRRRNMMTSRWETSEYGSENTSPIGYHRQHQRRHQEEEEDEEEEEPEYQKTYKYQDVKRKIRQHYEERLFNYERTQRSDHRQIKELEKEKDDLVKMLLQSNAKLEKEKKKSEYFKRKWQEAEQQLSQKMSLSGTGGFGGFQPATPQFQPMFPFGGAGSAQRYSFMGAPMHPISSSNTPTTSAMDTTHGGAGESLVPASDVSFLAPLPTLPNMELPKSANTSHTQPSSSSFFHDDDEDQDETKNFRDVDDVELPRGSSNTLTNDDDVIEHEHEFYGEALVEGKDSGFSTTPDDEKKKDN